MNVDAQFPQPLSPVPVHRPLDKPTEQTSTRPVDNPKPADASANKPDRDDGTREPRSDNERAESQASASKRESPDAASTANRPQAASTEPARLGELIDVLA